MQDPFAYSFLLQNKSLHEWSSTMPEVMGRTPCCWLPKISNLSSNRSINRSINTRLLGRFAPIFYSNCEPFLFANIEKQATKSSLTSKKIRGFKKFWKSNFDGGKFGKFWSLINLSWGHCEIPQKNWAGSVRPFWRLLDTNT